MSTEPPDAQGPRHVETLPPVPPTPAPGPLDAVGAMRVGFENLRANPGPAIGVGATILGFGVIGQIPFLGILISLLVLPAVQGGIATYSLAQVRRGEGRYEQIWSCFPRWGTFVGCSLLIALVALIAVAPGLILMLAGSAFEDSGMAWVAWIPGGIAYLAGLVALAWICLRLMFAFLLLADVEHEPGLGVMDALRRSWDLTCGHMGSLLLYALLCVGVAVAGLLALCVGIIAAAPIIWFATVALYDQVRTRT